MPRIGGCGVIGSNLEMTNYQGQYIQTYLKFCNHCTTFSGKAVVATGLKNILKKIFDRNTNYYNGNNQNDLFLKLFFAIKT